jgi:fibronectin-binding autotransporter adhesin
MPCSGNDTIHNLYLKGGLVVGSGGLTLFDPDKTIVNIGPGNITGNGSLILRNTATGSFLVTSTNINCAGAITCSGSGPGTNTISGRIGANVTALIQSRTNSVLILSGTNTYSGPTTVSAGALKVSNVVSLPTNTALTVLDNALVDLNAHTQTVASVAGCGSVGNGWLNVASALYPGGSNAVGTLTVTNLALAENSTIYWDFGSAGSDTNRVLGRVNLPTVATVRVSQVGGVVPSGGVLFSAGSLGGATNLSGWTVSGVGSWVCQADVANKRVVLVPSDVGPVFFVK